MANQEAMRNMMWGFIGQQYNKLPDRVKQALSQLEVRIKKEPHSLVILVKVDGENEDVVRAGEILINQLHQFLPEYLNKSFKVKVHVYGE